MHTSPGLRRKLLCVEHHNSLTVWVGRQPFIENCHHIMEHPLVTRFMRPLLVLSVRAKWMRFTDNLKEG